MSRSKTFFVSDAFKSLRDSDFRLKYECRMCPFRSSYERKYTHHMAIHRSYFLFKCKMCFYGCSKESELVDHLRTHYESNPFACHLCDFKVASKKTLDRHKRTHIGKKIITCDVCDYKTISSKLYKKHLNFHADTEFLTKYTCKICGNKCGRRQDLLDHLKTGHLWSTPFACDLCDYRSTSAIHLSQHLKTYHGGNPFVCKMCPFRNVKLSPLIEHASGHWMPVVPMPVRQQNPLRITRLECLNRRSRALHIKRLRHRYVLANPLVKLIANKGTDMLVTVKNLQ